MTLAERTYHRELVANSSDNPEAVYITKKFSPTHDGYDIGTHRNAWEIFALEKGKVVYVETNPNRYTGGLFVRIEYPRLGLELGYRHINKYLVKKGDIVDENTVIALTGYTGRTVPEGVGGTHLHLAVKDLKTGKFIDPAKIDYQPENKPIPTPEPEPAPTPIAETKNVYKVGEKPVIVKAGTIYYNKADDVEGTKAGITQKTDYNTSIAIEFINSNRPRPINVYNNAGEYLGWIRKEDLK